MSASEGIVPNTVRYANRYSQGDKTAPIPPPLILPTDDNNEWVSAVLSDPPLPFLVVVAVEGASCNVLEITSSKAEEAKSAKSMGSANIIRLMCSTLIDSFKVKERSKVE
jgi:hypothetical protein